MSVPSLFVSPPETCRNLAEECRVRILAPGLQLLDKITEEYREKQRDTQRKNEGTNEAGDSDCYTPRHVLGPEFLEREVAMSFFFDKISARDRADNPQARVSGHYCHHRFIMGPPLHRMRRWRTSTLRSSG